MSATIVTRPDGVELHTEAAGEGALVVIAIGFFGHPLLRAGFEQALVGDHRVVTYDMRGTGASTRTGPYDLDTDAGDLAAVAEAHGGGAIVFATGNAANAAVRVAAAQPAIVVGVVTVAANPLGKTAGRRSEGLAGSASVMGLLTDLGRNDYRAMLRSLVETTGRGLDEDTIRARVDGIAEYSSGEASVDRIDAWVEDEILDRCQALGDRLTVLHVPGPFFPADMLEPARELLPEARVEQIEGSLLENPQLVADAVRDLSGITAG